MDRGRTQTVRWHLQAIGSKKEVIKQQESIMALLNDGDQAPAFSLPNQDGSAVELSSLAGKNVLMWWYPKADTPG